MLSRRLFPVGDVRVALDQADRRKHRAVPASSRVSACRAATTCTRATASLAASRTCRCAACRSPSCARRQRRARDAAPHQRRRQLRVPAAAPAAHRLAAQASGATATRSARDASVESRADGRDPSARQSLVRGGLVHGAHDPALLRGELRGALRVRERSAAGLQPFCAGFVTRVEHAHVLLARDQPPFIRQASRSSAPCYDGKLGGDSRADARAGRSLPRELSSTCSCSSRPSARASRGARIEAADLYDRAIAAARAQAIVNIEALGRRARGRASGSRDGKPDFARTLSRQGAAGATRRGARPARSPIFRRSTGLSAARSATVVRHVELHDARPVGGTLGRARSRDGAQGEPGDRRRDRARAAARASSWTSSERTPARSPSSWCSSPTASFSSRAPRPRAGVARVLDGEPLRQSVACSTGIVNYVLRTSELVVLDDAAQQGNFRSDAYVHQPPPEVGALRAGCAQRQAHRRRLSREQPSRRRVHAGSARGTEHPDVADRRLDRERDALQPAGAAEPSDRSRQRDADEGDRRAQARRGGAQPLQGPPRGPRQGTHPRAREARRAASSTCRAAPAWPRSRPACCTTSATS